MGRVRNPHEKSTAMTMREGKGGKSQESGWNMEAAFPPWKPDPGKTSAGISVSI